MGRRDHDVHFLASQEEKYNESMKKWRNWVSGAWERILERWRWMDTVSIWIYRM